MTQAADIELFDKWGKFVMPTPEAISLLDANGRERFEAVRLAALEAEAAATATVEARKTVTHKTRDVRTAEDALRQLRPPVSAVDAARQWISSTR